jgi:lambda family phage portal protein
VTATLAQARQYLATRGLDKRGDSREWYLADRVRQPYSVVLRQWAGHRAAVAAKKVGKPRQGQRSFAAGGLGPMLSGMGTTDWQINQSLYQNLKTLRARSNELARNNDLAKQFLRLVRVHVVGPVGVSFQAQVTDARGNPVDAENTRIETAWATWGKREACDFAGELSWVEFQQLWITTMAREGEVLVRRIKGAGPHGYQLQLISPAMLDETLHRELENGHRVRMGIEFDANWRRVAYWLSQDLTRNPMFLGVESRKYTRVDASEIWHDFLHEYIGQWRGIPWMATTIPTQKRLSEFEDAGLMAAEEGAKKLAWLRTPTGGLEAMANGQTVEAAADQVPLTDPDDEDLAPVSGTLYTESGQGVHYASLPPGYEPVAFDSKYPDASAPDFMEHFARRIAAGLGVPYHALTGNLSGVNYTSSRTGELEVRELWKTLQVFLIERLHARVYVEWLPMAMLSGALPGLSMAQLPRYQAAATWQGHRWTWVDPVKDIDAALKEAGAGITSVSRIIREKGYDPDTVFSEIRRERERYADVFALLKSLAPNQPAPAAEPPDSLDEPEELTDPEDPSDD